jgi:exopolyphosphatase/pppGpp-phosphohydrolase
MEAERAEILPAGLACLGAALERLAAPTFRTTTKGLRHGLAHEIAHAFPDG